MRRRFSNRFRLLALGTVVLCTLAVTATPAAATTPACSTVGIATLNSALGIDAAHVSSQHPRNALICSYYGNSGKAANEATINYIPTTARSFAALKASNASSHAVRTITSIKSGAYSYDIGTERYLYVLDGTEQVQMFAIVPLAKLETLAREMPSLS
jgi:hypothetical protein